MKKLRLYKRFYYWCFTFRNKKLSELVANNIIFWGTIFILIATMINENIYYNKAKESITDADIYSAGTLALFAILFVVLIISCLFYKHAVLRMQKKKNRYYKSEYQYEKATKHLKDDVIDIKEEKHE